MRNRNLLSVIIIVTLAIFLVLSIALLFTSIHENSKIRHEIASKYSVMNSYAEKSRLPISKESIAILTGEQNNLKSIYARFKLALMSPLNDEISEEELDPLQFKERLIQIQKKLREDAEMHNLALPESMGFTKYETELSERSEIPRLIKRLKVLEEIVYVMIAGRADSIDHILFMDAGAKKTTDKISMERSKEKIKASAVDTALLQEMEKKLKRQKNLPEMEVSKKEHGTDYDFPVSLAVTCANSRLTALLYKLRVSPYIFVIDDIIIERIEGAVKDRPAPDSAGESRLRINLSVRAVALD